MVAFIPEPHILLMVEHTVLCARPAPNAAWRAGAWPWPACSTQPMITSSTASGARPARPRVARIAVAPSSAAVTSLKSPRKPPMGVRAALTITTGSDCLFICSLLTESRSPDALRGNMG